MNLPTIIVASIVGVIFLSIILTAIKNKKNGKHSCSSVGGCKGCSMNGTCH